jgi:serine/threonine-protein kinase RsbT
MEDEVVVAITSDADLVTARAEGRELANRLGFSRTDATLIATAISEIARNIVIHVGSGELRLRAVYEDQRYGLTVEAADQGPGIPDVEAAMAEHSRLRGTGLGLGLPGARRLMDEFDVISRPGRGTTVKMAKWRIRDELERLRERRRGNA